MPKKKQEQTNIEKIFSGANDNFTSEDYKAELAEVKRLALKIKKLINEKQKRQQKAQGGFI